MGGAGSVETIEDGVERSSWESTALIPEGQIDLPEDSLILVFDEGFAGQVHSNFCWNAVISSEGQQRHAVCLGLVVIIGNHPLDPGHLTGNVNVMRPTIDACFHGRLAISTIRAGTT